MFYPLGDQQIVFVKRLEIIEYPPDRSPYTTRNIPDPNWSDVEAAIRALDKHRFPFVNLCGTYEWSDDDYLTIMGGVGVYWLALTAGSHDQRRLLNVNRGNHEVELWTTDQGFADYEFHTTDNIEDVFVAAKHFCETGDCAPSLTWDEVA